MPAWSLRPSSPSGHATTTHCSSLAWQAQDLGRHPAQDDLAAARPAHRVGARAVDRCPDQLGRHLVRPPWGRLHVAAADRADVDAEAVAGPDAAREALGELLAAEADMAFRGCFRFPERDGRGDVELERRGDGLGDDAHPVEQQQAPRPPPRSGAAARWRRQPQRHLGRPLHERGEPTGRVPAVRGLQRPAVVAGDVMFSPVSRKPVEFLLSASPSPRSTPSSATWRVTASAFSPLSRTRASASADLVLLPELAVTGTRPRICCSAPASCARRRSRSARSPGRHRRDGARRDALVRPRPVQRPRRLRRRGGRGGLPEALPAELRGLRRGPGTSRRGGASCCCAAGGRSSARRSARTCGSRARPRPTSPSPAGCRAARQPVRLALPRRQGRGPRGDARHRARDNSAYLAFCNLVGGQDELLFDGHSVVLDDEGR